MPPKGLVKLNLGGEGGLGDLTQVNSLLIKNKKAFAKKFQVKPDKVKDINMINFKIEKNINTGLLSIFDIKKAQIIYSRVPNTTVGNPYSFFGACPSYMALFGTSRLLNFKKSSFLHFYSELLAY